jgi:diguanylate cyclase (GGDEF)-like protein
MTLDRWVSRRLAAIIAAFATLSLLATLVLVRERFNTLEAWMAERQLERVERVLAGERAEVERLAADYANWDDTLDYIKGVRPEFVTVNFPRNTGENLNVDAVVLRAPEGRLILAIDFGADDDFQAWGAPSVEALQSAFPAWPQGPALRRGARLLFIDGQPAVVGRASVSDSAMEVPAAGSLAFVRILDDQDLERLAGLAGAPFQLEPIDTGPAPPRVVASSEGWLARERFDGAVQVRVDVPALLTTELVATASALAIMAMLNLVICVVWVRAVLRRKVTGRLGVFADLSRRMNETGLGGQRWPVSGDDEIDRLASALNQLVDDLDRHRSALDRLAYEDAVTGLANRRRLLERMAERVAGPPAPSALVYIDLVGFKPINDALGHAAGDAVLRRLAERMAALPSPLVCAARIGGDEFGLLLDGVGQEDAAEWFGTIVDDLVAEVEYGGQRVRFDLLAGIAERPPEGDASAWLSMADLAMYAVRRQRSGRIGLYAPALGAAAQSRHVIALRLREAIAGRAVEAWFQPLVRLRDDAVVGVEALARWRVDNAWVPPSDFIPVAEEEGLMPALTLLMLGQACDFLQAASAAGRDELVCSVNVSALQVADARLPDQWSTLVASRGIAPGRIAFEVTEDAFESRPEWIAATFQAIRSRGFQLWLDDFGTGHSSLARLRDYPFDVLKVDRSFVRSRSEPKAAELLEGIVRFGQRIGLTVTAEGIETAEDLDALRAMGCDRAQGFHLARPMPAHQGFGWLAARQR